MKLTTYISFLLLLSIVVLSGCKKEEFVDPPGSELPIFELHGTLGNEALDLVAGDNDALMLTSTKQTNGVRVFTGELTDGSTSIELGLFDGNIDIPNSVPEVDIQNAVLQLARRYHDPLAVLTINDIVPNGNGTHVDWYINGSFAGSGQVSIYEPGKYDVCAHVTFLTGQTEQLCDEIILGYERNSNCNILLDLSQNYLEAQLNTNGEPVNVEWFLNDTLIGSANTLSHPLTYGIGHKLTARVTFTNTGVVREKSCFIDGTDPTQWISDFSAFEYGSTPSITPQDYQVRLIIEKNGKTYRSMEAENQGSTITLLSLEPYENNASGNKTYKAVVQVEAVVMEMSSEKKLPVNFTATLGIEVP
ncbi:MAG: hypothetical protein NXI10_04735 [bacterium]|nr:hypothetical protein [bacterium]